MTSGKEGLHRKSILHFHLVVILKSIIFSLAFTRFREMGFILQISVQGAGIVLWLCTVCIPGWTGERSHSTSAACWVVTPCFPLQSVLSNLWQFIPLARAGCLTSEFALVSQEGVFRFGTVEFLMELESILWLLLLLLDPLNQFCFQVHWCLSIDLPLSFLLYYTKLLLEFLQVVIDHVFSSKLVNLRCFRQKTKYSLCAQDL